MRNIFKLFGGLFILICLGFSIKDTFKYDVECDLINYNKEQNKYVLNVRVVKINRENKERLLIASENVAINYVETDKLAESKNSCKAGFLKNGDFIFADKYDYKYCLKDLLKNDDILYGKYLTKTRSLIKNTEKD